MLGCAAGSEGAPGSCSGAGSGAGNRSSENCVPLEVFDLLVTQWLQGGE